MDRDRGQYGRMDSLVLEPLIYGLNKDKNSDRAWDTQKENLHFIFPVDLCQVSVTKILLLLPDSLVTSVIFCLDVKVTLSPHDST